MTWTSVPYNSIFTTTFVKGFFLLRNFAMYILLFPLWNHQLKDTWTLGWCTFPIMMPFQTLEILQCFISKVVVISFLFDKTKSLSKQNNLSSEIINIKESNVTKKQYWPTRYPSTFNYIKNKEKMLWTISKCHIS